MTALPPVPTDLCQRFAVSRESVERIEVFLHLLLRWQERTNLVAPSTIPSVWERHVADSLQLLRLIPPAAKSVADLGSGSGFPGLVLACCGFSVHFYEANSRKAAFLREALRLTQSAGQVHDMRLETVRDPPVVDVVTARALAPLPRLLELAEAFLRHGATGLFHKGQDVDNELTEAEKYWRIRFRTEASVTDSKAVILVVEEASRRG